MFLLVSQIQKKKLSPSHDKTQSIVAGINTDAVTCIHLNTTPSIWSNIDDKYDLFWNTLYKT